MLPLQSKLARTALGLGVREAALLANLNSETVNRIEKDDSVKAVTISRVADMYRFLGIIFIDDQNKPGILLDLERFDAAKSDELDDQFNQEFSIAAERRVMLGSFLSSMAGRDASWTASDYVIRLNAPVEEKPYHRKARPKGGN